MIVVVGAPAEDGVLYPVNSKIRKLVVRETSKATVADVVVKEQSLMVAPLVGVTSEHWDSWPLCGSKDPGETSDRTK